MTISPALPTLQAVVLFLLLASGSVPLPDSAKPLKSGDPQRGEWEIQPADGNSPWNIAFPGNLRRGDLFQTKDYAGYFEFWDNGLGHLARPWQVK